MYFNWHPFPEGENPPDNELVIARLKDRKQYAILRYMGNELWAEIGKQSIITRHEANQQFSRWSLIHDPGD